MILNDRFVYIHVPKTGGTFVTNMLYKLHPSFKSKSVLNKYLERLALLSGKTGNFIIDTNRFGTKHEGCRVIPQKFIKKTIFSTIRNPYDYYVSQYEFGWWKKYPKKFFFDVDEVLKVYQYSNLDEISFEDFVKIRNSSLSLNKLPEIPQMSTDNTTLIGRQTYFFIKLFFKTPVEEICRTMNEKMIFKEEYKQDMFPVQFLRTERLNQELYNILGNLGYPSEDIKFILNEGKVYPPEGGRTETQKWQKYYSPELKEFVRNKENFLFTLFPEYDI